MSRARDKHIPGHGRRDARRSAGPREDRSEAQGSRGFLGALKPDLLRRIEAELDDKLAKIPTDLNEYGYDPWGFSLGDLKKAMIPAVLMYRYWFRVKTKGIENIPHGRVLLIGNHAGQIALDAAMLGTAMILEGQPPRVLRGMGEFWLPSIPWFNIFMDRIGGVVGTPKNCVDLLRHGEAISVFPEGVRGMNKLFRERYHLQRFGLGFMRLALQTNTPIVPVGIVGSEEQAIAIANLGRLGKMLGMPAFPVTVTWPFLGPLGFIPFPSRYHIEFGEPMRFSGNHDDEDHLIEEKVDKVKARIAKMLDEGRRRRKSIYF